MAAKKKFYVVWRGRKPGIYTTWAEAQQQIDGFSDARFKGFATREEAIEAFKTQPNPLPAFITKPAVKEAPPTPKPLIAAIAVDAACSGNPGVMEYRGISLWDNKEIFHQKFDKGTNNIGEFLAIVEALARLKKANSPKITIYSDSQIAIGWVKRKECRTKLQYTPMTAQLLDIVARAENWLATNAYENPIVKWPTDLWGEIPADFGRK